MTNFNKKKRDKKEESSRRRRKSSSHHRDNVGLLAEGKLHDAEDDYAKARSARSNDDGAGNSEEPMRNTAVATLTKARRNGASEGKGRKGEKEEEEDGARRSHHRITSLFTCPEYLPLNA